MLDELFSGNMLFFSVPAVAGTIFFTIRLVLMLAGLGGDDDALLDSPSLDADGADPHDSTESFKVLSIQSIAAFLMGFGWGGLGGMRGAGWGFDMSLLTAVAGGVGMVWLLSWLLNLAHKLQSSGTIPIRAAQDAKGEVYVTIPPKGQGFGQVRVVVNQRLRTYNADSVDESPLPTNTPIRVVRVNDNNTLTVQRL